MIVERKQYGCITLLFVQIGLALFVIVVFFAQATDGTIKPTVLKVQKVATARQAEIKQLLETKYQALAGQNTKQGQGIYIDQNRLYGDIHDLSIDLETRTQVENTIAEAFANHIEQSQFAKTQLALSGAQSATTAVQLSVQNFAFNKGAERIHFSYFSSKPKDRLEQLGAKPRAPTLG